jgi:hypothetical protein
VLLPVSQVYSNHFEHQYRVCLHGRIAIEFEPRIQGLASATGEYGGVQTQLVSVEQVLKCIS